MIAIAQQHFGFQTGRRLSVVAGDGLAYVEQLAKSIDSASAAGAAASASTSSATDTAADAKAAAPAAAADNKQQPQQQQQQQRVDLIIVDVNAQDLTIGLSFPPRAFLAPSFLLRLKQCLTPTGRVLFNFGACLLCFGSW